MAERTMSPGWYPDPDGAAGERWWNGAGWSDTRRGGPAQVPVPPTRVSTTVPPPVYSATNPAPQRPDPYAPPTGTPTTSAVAPNPNRPAVVGLVLGLVSLFLLNILAPVAIGVSIAGLNRAKVLKAAGVAAHSTVLAVVGLVTGIIAFVTGLITFIVAIAASLSTDYSYDLWSVVSGSILSRLF